MTMNSTPYVPRHVPRTAALQGRLVRLVRAAARVAQRRPKTIIAAWLLLVVVCVGSGSLIGSKSLTSAQSEVGESASADTLIHNAGLADPATENILVTSSDASLTRAAVDDLTARLRPLSQVAAVRGPAQSPVLSTDGGRTELVQATLRGDPDKSGDNVAPVENAVGAVGHAHSGVTVQEAGEGSENKAINDLITKDLSRAERISLPITLVILLLAFGALVAASVPLLLGLTSVAAALGALGLVSQIAPSGDSTSPVMVLIGLAVGVDYSLFYVRREREERRRGRPDRRRRTESVDAASNGESALDAAAASVGRAILVSGITVMIALAGLLISGQGDFISMALGTIIVVLIAVVGSLTVLPAVLALLGDRVDRGRIPGYRWLLARRTRREEMAGQPLGLWASVARAVTRSPLPSLVAAACILAALAVPLFGMHTANLGLSDMPKDLPVVQAAKAIDQAFPGTPQNAVLVVTGSGLGGAQEQLTALGNRALQVTGGRGDVTVGVSRDGTVARIDVPMPDRGDDAAKATVTKLRTQVAPSAATIPGAHGKALVSGDAASSLDYANRMNVATPEVIGFVLLLGFLLLLLTFRAPLLAAAVMVLNLLSIGAAYGILTAIFQHTWAEHILNFDSTGHVIDWLPLFMFVLLFGLSMDYTILVLERIREARLAGLRPRQAAAEGVAATAGTVTSAAVVMVAVFAIFATLDIISLKQIGVGLAAAVLLDATLVRGIALPAAVTLLGERGWPVRRPAAVPMHSDFIGREWDDADMPAGDLVGRA